MSQRGEQSEPFVGALKEKKVAKGDKQEGWEGGRDSVPRGARNSLVKARAASIDGMRGQHLQLPTRVMMRRS